MDRVKSVATASDRAVLPHLDPRRCVILVPFATYIAPQCERALDELERRGYPVNRVRGYANIDLGRNQIATDVLAAGFQETFWIDADMDFHPDAVDRLRSHNLPISCGIYARRNTQALAAKPLPETTSLSVGQGAGLIEIMYGGTGFMHVRREVYETIQRQLALPVCNAKFARPLVPYFQPLVIPFEPPSAQAPPGAAAEKGTVPFSRPPGDSSVGTDGARKLGQSPSYWYLADDFSFCERARQCGYKIMADASIRLWHLGEHAYGWEDAGLQWPRYESFKFESPGVVKKA